MSAVTASHQRHSFIGTEPGKALTRELQSLPSEIQRNDFADMRSDVLAEIA